MLANLAQELDLARADIADAGQLETNPELDRRGTLLRRDRAALCRLFRDGPLKSPSRPVSIATNDLAALGALDELYQRTRGRDIA